MDDPLTTAEILDENAFARTLTRLSFEIIERGKGADGLCLIGLLSRGAVLARRISDKITESTGLAIPTGTLDVTPYRDDGRTRPGDGTRIDFDITDKRIVLVDDVIYTGRTARAAINGIMARGRPGSIQFAALVDRGHRELPIKADFIGKNIPTSSGEKIKVMVKETDGCDKVIICRIN